MHKNQDRAQKKCVKNCKIEAKRGRTEGGKHAAALKFFFKKSMRACFGAPKIERAIVMLALQIRSACSEYKAVSAPAILLF